MGKGYGRGWENYVHQNPHRFPLPDEDLPRTLSFPFIVRPAGVLICKRQNGLGLTRVRSSVCFSAPIFSATGFVRPRGRRGVRFGGALSLRQAFHHSSASPGETSSAGLALRKESLQPEQTLSAWNAPGNGMHGQVSSPPGSARRTRLTHPASPSAERAPHGCLVCRSRGREFADLGLRRTLPELGPARRPMSAPRGGLGSPRAR